MTAEHVAPFSLTANSRAAADREFDRLLRVHESLTGEECRVGEYGRGSPVEVAYDRVRRWAPTGGVTRLARSTDLDRVGIPNYYAVRPTAKHPCSIISSGKGPTPELAMLSALFEALERAAAEEYDGPVLFCSRVELADFGGSTALAAPPNLDERMAIPWAFGYDLISRRPCFLPLQNVIFPWTNRLPRAPIQSDTNGLASGTYLLEALCSAVFELIERDAMAGLSAATRNRVDPATCPDAVRRLINRFQSSGVDISLFRLASATTVPVFYAISRDDSIGLSHYFCSGYGAHSDPVIAASRALTEVSQSRVSFITTLRDDIAPEMRPFAGVDYTERRHSLEALFAAGPSVPLSDGSIRTPGTFGSILTHLVDEVRRVSADSVLAYVPLRTPPGLAAVRAYCPNLRGIVVPRSQRHS